MTQYSVDTDASKHGEAIWDMMKSHISKRETIKSFILRLVGAYNVARGAGVSHKEIVARIVADTGVPATDDAIAEYNRARSDDYGDGLEHEEAVEQAANADG